MKNRIITAVVLLAVFVAALAGFSVLLNRGTDDMTADMGSPKLPVIYFEESGYGVNPLVGYTEEMDIPTMRDMILPVSVGTSITANIAGYEGKINAFTYDILTLDGVNSLKSETVNDVKDAVKIELGESIADGGEKVLRITLETEYGERINYYMRVVRAAEFNVQQCLEFAEDFHKTALESEDLTELKQYLGAEGAPEGNGLQKVTLASSIENIGWGELVPEIVGDVVWEIKESNGTYTSVILKYRVKAKGDSEKEDIYNVTEFFKVRFIRGKASLESYIRTMNEVFEGHEKNFDKKGIVLGLADENVPYLTSESGDYISFVQEREVWNYNKKDNRISLLFSFADAEGVDIRNYNDNHSIRLLDMDEKGNTSFAAYGYMNRGAHEGQVGTAIYYYNLDDNYVQEKAFIPSNNSGEIAQRSLNRLIYYNEPSNVLYVMAEGTLYKVDLKSLEKEVIQADLTAGQYTASPNGRYVAYQTEGTISKADSMNVWNLETEKNFEVEVAEDEVIRPLGFVRGDIVYGIGRETDVGKNASGEDIVPLYKLEIRNGSNEVVKSYEAAGTYISDVSIEGDLITVERVVKNGELYESTVQDSITNNKKQSDKSIEIEKVSSETKGFRIRMTGGSGLENTSPKLFKPKQMLFERATTIAFDGAEAKGNYYVYGFGRLQGIYDKAGDAIHAADSVRGVVVTSKQTKMWERGNRMLTYRMDGANAFSAGDGESSLAACLRQMLAYEGQNVNVASELAGGKSVLDVLNEYSGGEAVDLTGCLPEQLCYIIGKGTPVLAMTGSDSAVLLVGYDDSTFTYLNPVTGQKSTVRAGELESMTKPSQGRYFGYVK